MPPEIQKTATFDELIERTTRREQTQWAKAYLSNFHIGPGYVVLMHVDSSDGQFDRAIASFDSGIARYWLADAERRPCEVDQREYRHTTF